jgi:membrane-associated phospholipid phosphatase
MIQFFRWISGILHPLLLPFVGTVLLFQTGFYRQLPMSYKLYVEGLVFFTTALLPALAILILRRKGVVADLDVSIRSQRIIPYVIFILAYLVTVLLLIRAALPWTVVKLYLGSLVSIFIAFFITLKWKISAHTMAYGCLAGGSFVVCLEQHVNPLLFFVVLLLLAGLQATSRVYLRAHSLAQAGGGFALGVVCVCGMYFLIP